MPPRKFFRRPRRKILRRRGGFRKKRVSSQVKRYVKKVIHGQIENKLHIDYGANQSIVINTPSTQSKGLIVPTAQGTTHDGRVGNQIKVVRGYIDMTFNCMVYNASSNATTGPWWVRVLVVKDLSATAQSSTFSTTQFSKLLQGNGTALGLQNNTLDILLGVNTDNYRVLYDKKFKLGFGSQSSSSIVLQNAFFDNSACAKKLRINWSKWCRKQLKFDDNTSPFLPMNDNLYLIYQAVPANGVSANSGDSFIEMHYVNNMFYEDA